MKKFLEWLSTSNRNKHLKCGLILFIANCIMYLLGHLLIFGSLSTITLITSIIYVIYAMINVFIPMCAVEYIQTTVGGKWDWLDVLAGMIPSFVGSIIFVLIFTLI